MTIIYCPVEGCGMKTTDPMLPNHYASKNCESGSHAHCTCDWCF